EDLDELLLAELRARINAEVAGLGATKAREHLATVAEAFPPADRPLITAIVQAINETLSEDVEERIVLAGTANLARSDLDFPRTIGPVLEALEEQMVLLRLLTEMVEDSTDQPLAVRMGRETHHENLAETAVIASGYGEGGDVVGKLGLL